MIDPGEPSQVDALLDVRPTSRARRWISMAILLLALGVAGWLLLRFLEGNTTPYYMAPIVQGDLRPHLTLSGRVYLTGEVTVRAPRNAMIIALPAAAGTAVAAGQAVAVVDTSGFARTLAADRSALQAAHDQLARASIDSRLARNRLARYARVWRESDHRVPSLNELESARVAAAGAALAVRRDRELFDAARRRLDDDMADVLASLPRAPFAGVVVQRLIEPGGRVQAGQALLELAPLGAAAHLVVPLPAGIGPLPAGMPARAIVAGTDGAERDARLLRIDTDPTGARQAVFALAPDPSIAPTSAATVKLTLPLRRDVLQVPNAALAFAPYCSTQPEREGSRICVLDRDGTARSVAITVGPSDGHRTQVLGGSVRPGQLAIIGWREAPGTPGPQPRSSGP